MISMTETLKVIEAHHPPSVRQGSHYKTFSKIEKTEERILWRPTMVAVSGKGSHYEIFSKIKRLKKEAMTEFFGNFLAPTMVAV